MADNQSGPCVEEGENEMTTGRHVPERWLSRGVEVLLESERAGDARTARPIDVLVVGSGYGGSVAAARFAAMRRRDGSERLRVVLLERGDEFVPGAFPDRFDQTISLARMERTLQPGQKIEEAQSGLDQALFDARVGPEVTAIVGNGLGGGSLINAGVVERPIADIFAQPAWPEALRRPGRSGDATALDRWFGQVETMLGAAPFDPLPPKSDALLDDTRALQRAAGVRPVRRALQVAVTQGPAQPAPAPLVHANAAGVRQSACMRCGNCISGCNHGAKNVLPMNYLALAKRHGAELYTGASVLAVSPDGEGGWVLSLRRTHDRRDRETPDALVQLRARHVVLAAGTFGTPQILHQSLSTPQGRAAFAHLDPAAGGLLGQGVSCNGDGIAAIHDQAGRTGDVHSRGVHPEAAGSGRAATGPTATAMIDLRGRADPRRRFVIQDGAVPFPFNRLFEEAITTFAAAQSLADWNRRGPNDAADDPLALSERRMRRTQFLLLMGYDDAGWHMDFTGSGSFAGQGERRVALSRVSLAPRRHTTAFEQEQERQEDIDRVVGALAQGRFGGRYVPNPLWAPVSRDLIKAMKPKPEASIDGQTASTLEMERGITVHPLGGCRMADSAESGVVNALGQVFADRRGTRVHANLVLLDGSIVPSALGINPLLTIAALAERACEQLAQAWGMTAAESPAADPPQLPAPVAPLPWPQTPTSVRYNEAMKGAVQLTADPCPPWPDAPAAAVRRDMLAELVVRGQIADLEEFLRDPRHTVSRAEADLTLMWHVAPTGPATPGRGNRDVETVRVGIGDLRVTLLGLLPSTREERVWRAMRHWLRARGRAFLHDEIRSRRWRRRALRLMLRALAIESTWQRKALLALIDWLPLPKLLGGDKLEEIRGLLKLASHHGEARAMRYDLGTVYPPAGKPWPFAGPVRIVGVKRLHYGDAAGYRQRPSTGAEDPLLPKRVPSQFWRALHELDLLVLSRSAGLPPAQAGWPADQWPDDLPPEEWQVAGRGTLRLATVPLLTTEVPQFGGYRTLADAWVDVASVAALLGRAIVQTAFWRLRLPEYPKPLPDTPDAAIFGTAVQGRSVGPLPGQVLDTHGKRYVEGRWPGLQVDRVLLDIPSARRQAQNVPCARRSAQIALTRFRPVDGGAAAEDRPSVLLIHAFVTSGYMFATPRVRKNAVQALTEAGFDTWVVDLRTSVALPGSHDPWNFDEVALEDVPAAVRHIYEARGGKPLHVIAQCMGSAVFNMAVLKGLLQDTVRGRSMVCSSVQVQVSMDIVGSYPNHLKAVLLRAMESLMGVDEVDVVADQRTLGASRRGAALADRLLWTWPTNDVDAMRMRDNRLDLPRQSELPGIRRIMALYGRNFSWDNLSDDVRRHLPELFRHASMEAIRHLIRMERAGHVVDSEGRDAYLDEDAIRQFYRFPVLFVHGQFATVFSQATTRRSRIRLDRLVADQPHRRLVLPRAGKKTSRAPRRWGHFDLWVSEHAATEFFPQLIAFLNDPGQRNAAPHPVAHELKLPTWVHLGNWQASADGGTARIGFLSPFGRNPAKPMAVEASVVAIQAAGVQTVPMPPGMPLILPNVRVTPLMPWTQIALSPSGTGCVEVEIPQAYGQALIHVVCRQETVALFSDPDYTRNGGGHQPWWMVPTLSRASTAATARAAAQAPTAPDPAVVTQVLVEPPRLFTPGNKLGIQNPSLWHHIIRIRGLPPFLRETRAPLPMLHEQQADIHAAIAAPLVNRARSAARAIQLNPRAFTQLEPQDDMRFLMASCRYQATPAEQLRADRVLQGVLDRQLSPHGPALVDTLDFALLMGDQVYADATYGVFDSRPSEERLRAKHADLWEGAAGALATRIPTRLCIDDHEIRDDWFDGLRPVSAEAESDSDRLRAAFDYQMAAVDKELRMQQLWYAFESCGFHFAVLDSRTERKGSGGDLWSRAQQRWFTHWLETQQQDAPERPLFVVTATPLFPFVDGFDSTEHRANGDDWSAYPRSLAQLLRSVLKAKVRHLVLLSGDAHLSHVAHGSLTCNGHRLEICSIVSSALNAPLPSVNTPRGQVVPRWSGPLRFGKRNFGHLAYEVGKTCDNDSAAVVHLQRDADARRFCVHVGFVEGKA